MKDPNRLHQIKVTAAKTAERVIAHDNHQAHDGHAISDKQTKQPGKPKRINAKQNNVDQCGSSELIRN